MTGLQGGEVGVGTEVTLNVKSVTLLPGVVLEREEDGLVTDLLADGVESLALVLGATAGSAVALATVGPAALKVESLLAGAHLAEDVELALDELASLGRLDVRVEESVNVGTNDVDGRAESGRNLRALPDVEGLGDGVRAGVTAPLGLAGIDEGLELTRGAEAVHDGLVTHDNEVNTLPVSPLANGVNLLLDVRRAVRAAALDEDTDNELHAVLLASGANGLKGVAVGGVDTESGEASSLDGNDILLNGTSRHAVTVLGVVRGVGDTVVVTVTLTELTRDGEATTDLDSLGLLLLGLLGHGLVLLGSLRLGGLRLRSRRSLNLGLLDLLNLGCGRRSLGGGSRRGSRLLRGGEGAVHDELVDGDSDRGGGGSVGARSVDGGAGVVDVGLLLDHGDGAGNDGADTGLVADVGGDGSLLTVGSGGIRAGDGG